ncbi:hypothetical protein [Clostridium sp.]|uniref:hypothetical protein n=1 Tax=Clostridium sp. TaxID=1506 RepID=UPI003D6D1CF2
MIIPIAIELKVKIMIYAINKVTIGKRNIFNAVYFLLTGTVSNSRWLPLSTLFIIHTITIGTAIAKKASEVHVFPKNIKIFIKSIVAITKQYSNMVEIVGGLEENGGLE